LPELSLGPAQNDQTTAKSPAPPTNAQIAQTNPMWWSVRIAEPEGTAITPFTVAVPDDDLLELKRRLTSARWPEKETVDDWSQGVPLDWLRDLCAYWAGGYDWRRCEARLNAYDQFVTTT